MEPAAVIRRSAVAAAIPAEGPSAKPSPFSRKNPSSVGFLRRHPDSRVSRPKPFTVCSALSMDAAATGALDAVGIALPRPDSFGRFGKFGGKYVPETLMHALSELEDAFQSLSKDTNFQVHSASSSIVPSRPSWNISDFFLSLKIVRLLGFC